MIQILILKKQITGLSRSALVWLVRASLDIGPSVCSRSNHTPKTRFEWRLSIREFFTRLTDNSAVSKINRNFMIHGQFHYADNYLVIYLPRANMIFHRIFLPNLVCVVCFPSLSKKPAYIFVFFDNLMTT